MCVWGGGRGWVEGGRWGGDGEKPCIPGAIGFGSAELGRWVTGVCVVSWGGLGIKSHIRLYSASLKSILHASGNNRTTLHMLAMQAPQWWGVLPERHPLAHQ